jgi:hypothetical protein
LIAVKRFVSYSTIVALARIRAAGTACGAYARHSAHVIWPDVHHCDARPPFENQDHATLDEELAHDVVQFGGRQSITKQEELKRVVRRHLQRELGRVESIEPSEVPNKI